MITWSESHDHMIPAGWPSRACLTTRGGLMPCLGQGRIPPEGPLKWPRLSRGLPYHWKRQGPSPRHLRWQGISCLCLTDLGRHYLRASTSRIPPAGDSGARRASAIRRQQGQEWGGGHISCRHLSICTSTSTGILNVHLLLYSQRAGQSKGRGLRFVLTLTLSCYDCPGHPLAQRAQCWGLTEALPR